MLSSQSRLTSFTVRAPLVTILALAILPTASALAQVAGPIEGGQRGLPFSAPTFDLEAHGYLVEEYFLTGKANSYALQDGARHGKDGTWDTLVRLQGTPFATRFLVVRPKEQKDFNGTVLVHWQNVTAGYELGTVTESEILRGYAWVGVSAQAIGIHGFPTPDANGLKQWDPERYKSLLHPGDTYSYDIFTQAARAISKDRESENVDPMGGLKIERLIASGASQSASRLRTYINGVHQHTQIFDAYIPYIDFANPVPFSADLAADRRRSRMPTWIRKDLGVPVLVVNSETETLSYFPARQPETETFRFWEVAGAAHVSSVRGAVVEGMDSPNWLAFDPVYNAAVRHMHDWLVQGEAPPSFPRIEVDTSAETAAVRRDKHGNARGGIRLPDLAVPTAAHSGMGTATPGGNRFAWLFGHAREFEPKKLAKLYDSGADFLGKYEAALKKSQEQKVVLPEEAPAMLESAREWAKKNLKSP